jgi:pimeloyl-ACP methyl ester carboxylesterase
VVFVHGGSAHARWWDFVAAHLLDRYRCVALDLRGHGDSGWSAAGDYHLETHAADVAALIDHLGAPTVALVGHSFGGFVAMRFAAHAGPRLSGLAIVDSRSRIGARSARFLEALGRFPHPRYVSIDDAVRRFRLLPAGHAAQPAILGHVVRHAIMPVAGDAWTLKFDRRAIAGLSAEDLSPALAAIQCPILAVRGEHSPIVSAEALAAFRAINPRAVTAEIAGAHHHVMLDQPEALADAIGRFVDPLLRP